MSKKMQMLQEKIKIMYRYSFSSDKIIIKPNYISLLIENVTDLGLKLLTTL